MSNIYAGQGFAPYGRMFSVLLSALLSWVLLLAVLGAQPAQAQSCSTTAFGINFGAVSRTANTDADAMPLPVTCQSDTNTTYFTVCLFIPPGGQSQGVDPRRMINHSTGSYVNYQLYSDAARTQIIGAPPAGAGYTVYAHSFQVAGGWRQSLQHLPVYGRVPPVPASVPAGGSYQEQINGIRLNYAYSYTGPPSAATCATAPHAHIGVGFTGAYINSVPSACSIGISQASDLNFGETSSLGTAINGQATITLDCPSGTNWKLGLNNGMHAASGQRRMAGPAGNHVEYELYQDAARSQRWGNDRAGGTDVVSGSGSVQSNPTMLQVYGRVPAQAPAAAGSYSDTITVTLEY